MDSTKPDIAEALEALERLYDRRKRSSSSAYEEACHQLQGDIADTLKAAQARIDELEARLARAQEQVGITRMCVNCGAFRPAEDGRQAPGEGCPCPDACTWDYTPQEAWLHWSKKAHDYRAQLARAVKLLRPFAKCAGVKPPQNRMHGDQMFGLGTSLGEAPLYFSEADAALAFIKDYEKDGK